MLISRALASAVLSSLVSTAVAGALSRGAGRAAAEPLNAVGGHLAGAPAVLSKRMSLQSTLPGVAINLGGCLFWAAVVEAWAQARPPARAADALGRGAIAASLAYLVDYHALPPRLRPGYERKLSPPQIMIIYAAL